VSRRTVRRRAAELLDELGATTRFQAGMQAARRRLI
jgi:DNA-binding NarL/FixJ family response regulator